MTDTDLTARLQRAVIFLSDPHDIETLDRCMQHIRDRRYLFAGVVSGSEHFEDAQKMLDEGQAQVLVMGGCGEVPPRTLRRWELVSHELSRLNVGPAAGQHRTHRINRRGEAN